MTNTRWTAYTGKNIEGAKTSDEAIVAAGLDWRVLQSPVKFQVGDKLMTADGQMVNYREDTGHVFGVVTDGYKILQNKPAFKFLDGIVGTQEAMFVNAGSFKGGAKVYVQAKLPGYIRFDGDGGQDVGEKLLTFITSHDGSLAISVVMTPVRIVCQNTLMMAYGQAKTHVKHTLNMFQSLNQAKNALGILNAKFDLLESISQKLSKTPFNAENIPSLVEKVGLVPEETERSTRAKNIIDDVMSRFNYGQGADLKSARGTAWGAYNAVVEYVDHFRGSNDAKRAESAILGSGADVKEKAFTLLSA